MKFMKNYSLMVQVELKQEQVTVNQTMIHSTCSFYMFSGPTIAAVNLFKFNLFNIIVESMVAQVSNFKIKSKPFFGTTCISLAN